MTCLNFAIDASPASAPLGYAMDDILLRWFGPDQGPMFDIKTPKCFARQGNPANGDAVVNLSNDQSTNNGTINQVAGITFAGGGLDFSGVTAPGNTLAMVNAFDAIEAANDVLTGATTNGSDQLTILLASSSPLKVGSLVSGTGIPANTLITALGTGTGGVGTYTMSANATATGSGVAVTVKNKEYMALLYGKMPPAASWPSSGRSICGAGNYGSAPDLFTVYAVTNGASKDLVFRFSTASGVHTAVTLAGAGTTFDGKPFQAFVERTPAGSTSVRLKSLDGTVTQSSTPVTLTTNTATLSGLTWRFGTMTSAQINNNFSAAVSWNATDIGGCQWRLYRAAILSTKKLPSTYTATMAANDDFTTTAARAAFT